MSRGLAFRKVARPRFVGQMASRDARGPVLSGKWLPAMREAPFCRTNGFPRNARSRFVGQMASRATRGPILSGKCLPAICEASFTGANAVSRGREAPFTGVNDILFNTII